MEHLLLLVRRFIKICLVLFILLMALLITQSSIKHFFPYTVPSTFLIGKQPYPSIYLLALYGHILSSGLILLVGIFGFSTWIQQKKLYWHRILGKLYVSLVLFISAPCGFIMAWFAQGGWSGSVCFLLLSILWWFFTAQAWLAICQKNIPSHRAFMLRSYALTCSAIFLRWYTFLLAYYWNMRGIETYAWIAWASWVPNLILVEFYLWKSKIEI